MAQKIELTKKERTELLQMVKTGKQSARELGRARILLQLDRGQGQKQTHQEIADANMVGRGTVNNIKNRYLEGGIEYSLYDRPRPGAKPKIDGETEAQLIALVCSDPPEGQERWTLRLLADRMVELQVVNYISHVSVGNALKKMNSSPKPCARFVANMEDVLSVYQRRYDPKRPQVCLDEIQKALRTTPRGEIPMEKGKPRREDHEYKRNGKCSMFLAVEPLVGFRQVWVRSRRTKLDFADVLRDLVDVIYSSAEKIVLVVDNLNIHHAACLYERFPPDEARRIAEKIEWHYTPVHGSWLNIAECELSVLKRQCLKPRLPDIDIVAEKVAAWVIHRNHAQTGIDWRFTTDDARIKLKRLYPVVNVQNSS